MIGYSSKSKGYKVFDLKTNQAVIARNVKVAENQIWNWDDDKIEDTSNELVAEIDDEIEYDEEDLPVRGTRLLSGIYDRCNLAEIEPNNVGEAMDSQVWVAAMKEELMMIEKNDTWQLVDRP